MEGATYSSRESLSRARKTCMGKIKENFSLGTWGEIIRKIGRFGEVTGKPCERIARLWERAQKGR